MAKDRDGAYQGLARDLRESILRGQIDDDTQLPTEAELVERYGVSRQTVRRAFQSLVAEGMVYRVPGRGTFVSPRDVGHLKHVGRFENIVGLPEVSDFELRTPLRLRVDVMAAARLQLDSDLVGHVAFRRLVDGRPFSFTQVFVPPHIQKRLAHYPELTTFGVPSRATVIGILEGDLGIELSEAQQSISAVRPDPGTLAHLDVSGGVVMRIDRLYRDVDGNAVELGVSFTDPATYSYRVRLRRSSAV